MGAAKLLMGGVKAGGKAAKNVVKNDLADASAQYLGMPIVGHTKGRVRRDKLRMQAARSKDPAKQLKGKAKVYDRPDFEKSKFKLKKTAGARVDAVKERLRNSPTAQTFGDNVVKGVAGVGAATAILGAIHGAGKVYDKIQTERIWNRLKKENPELTNNARDREYFEVIQDFSPSIASNYTTARTYLQRMKQMGMAPHELARDLSSVEQNVRKGGLGGRIQSIVGGPRLDGSPNRGGY